MSENKSFNVAERLASLRERVSRRSSENNSPGIGTTPPPAAAPAAVASPVRPVQATARKSFPSRPASFSQQQSAIGVVLENASAPIDSSESSAHGAMPNVGDKSYDNSTIQQQQDSNAATESMDTDPMGLEEEESLGESEEALNGVSNTNSRLLDNVLMEDLSSNNNSITETIEEIGSDNKADDLVIPLCLCRIPSDLRNDENPPPRCEAVSYVDGERHGCSNRLNVARGVSLHRAHVRIPFMALCTAHLNLLRHHYCCPTCGVFCLKGSFNQCLRGRPAHYFHQGCATPNDCCPHCLGNQFSTTNINVYSEKPKIDTDFIYTGPRAKISITSRHADPKLVDPTCQAPATQRQMSTGLLARKEDRDILESTFNRIKVPNFTPKKNGVYEALNEGDVDSLCYLLANGADPNQCVEGRNRGIHVAVQKNHYLCAYLLLQAGADPNLQTGQTQTPLVLACDQGSAGLTQLLLRFGADPSIRCHYRDTSSSTALHIAAVNGHTAVVHFILKSASHMTNVQDDGGWTPLAWATEHGQSSIANLLLDHGAKPMLRDVEGNICMHWAAYSGCQMIADRLLKINGQRALRSKNNYGDQPLHVAIRREHWDLVRVFLSQSGCDVKAENDSNETPLSMMRALNAPAEVQGVAQIKAQSEQRFKSERIVNVDLSGSRENFPIQVINAVDNEDKITNFIYVPSLVETLAGLGIDRRINNLQHCECEDDCSSGNCACVQQNGQPSNSSGLYNDDRTLSDYLDRSVTDTIYECNPACNCSANCRNRVAQKGIGTHLQIFKTADRGWAVRTLERVRKGQFICEYAGEILTGHVADARDDDSYLFEMESDGLCHCIDAKTYGNVARFVNHGCAPNLIPLKVFWDHQDERFPHICFYADSEIKEGEELTFDYGDKFWIVKYRHFLCKCGSEACKYDANNIQHFLAEQKDEAMDESGGKPTQNGF